MKIILSEYNIHSAIKNSKSLNYNKFPTEINKYIEYSLQEVGRKKYAYLFKNNIEVLPLIMNLINALAKKYYETEYDPDEWYEYKDDIIKYLIEYYSNHWNDGEIIFFETPYGQISAHIFDDTQEIAKKYGMNSQGSHRKWNGANMQRNAVSLIDDYIEDAIIKNHE